MNLTNVFILGVAFLLSVFTQLNSAPLIKSFPPAPQSTPVITPTSSNEPLITSQPKQNKPSQEFLIQWQYPNSNLIKQENYLTSLESFDDPSVITNWYKEKIQSQGLNSISFIQTNTNNNISNKLVGSNGQTEIRVDIDRGSNDLKTTIMLNIS